MGITMKTAFLLPVTILVISCQALPVPPSPNDLQITTFGDENNSWFVLKWGAATNPDETDPITGYKMKVWKVDKVKSTHYAFKDGKLVKEEVEELPEIKVNEEPKGELTVIDVPANKTEATFKGMKVGVTYEVGVLAYTAKSEGIFSNKIRATLNE